MKINEIPIDYNAVTRRIEKEMEGYKRSAWAENVGVTINVVSNIHGASAKQNPSLKYILAVSLATGKPMDYYLWGRDPKKMPDPRLHVVRESEPSYSDIPGIPPRRDPQMGRRVKYWRRDMGLTVPEVAKRSNLPENLVSQIEAGYHTTTDVIGRIAETLRCSTDYLLGCGGASIAQPLKLKK